MQSIFTDIGKINFRDPSSYYLIPSVPGLAANSVTSAAWLSSDGEALFALPSAAGGIFVIKLPPHDVPGKAASLHLLLCNTGSSLLVLDLDGFGFCHVHLMALLHTQRLFCISLPAGSRCFINKH